MKENAKDVIRQHLFYKKKQTDRHFSIKIQHSHIDANSFNLVMKHGLDNMDAVPNTQDNKILGCYHFYLNEFIKFSEEEKEELFNFLLDQDNKILVVIDLQQGDDEQAIFDTINSAGVRLSPSDIVKNALFQAVIKFSSSENAIEIYTQTWDKLFVKGNIRFWETQRTTGRITRDNLEILLHSIAVIKNFYDPEKDTLSDLSKFYKKKIESFDSIEKLEVFINEIKTYGELYQTKMLSFNNSTLFSYSNPEQRLFHILNKLDISTFHPFILYLYYIYKDNNTELTKYLNLVSSFVVRKIIAGLETRSFNKLAKDLIENPSLLIIKLEEIPTVDYINGFKHISNKNASIILFWIELKRRFDDPNYSQDQLKYNYTLENIMPQKLNQFWPLPTDKTNSDGVSLSDDAVKLNRQNKIFWIGNMTLLTSSLNISLRNYDYNRKMNGEQRKKGIRAYAELSITNHDLVLPYDAGMHDWNEDKIVNRTNKLIEEAIKIW